MFFANLNVISESDIKKILKHPVFIIKTFIGDIPNGGNKKRDVFEIKKVHK